MKRFWLEDQDRWFWSSTTRMAHPGVPRISPYYLLVIILFIHFVPSSCTVGETCDPSRLSQCSKNEICREVNETTAVCECRKPFEVDKETGKCENPKPAPPPPDPSGSNLGLALGLGITFFLIFVIIALVLIHRKFGLFSGMCDRFPSLRSLAIRSGDIIMVDNGDEEDINPIV